MQAFFYKNPKNYFFCRMASQSSRPQTRKKSNLFFRPQVCPQGAQSAASLNQGASPLD